MSRWSNKWSVMSPRRAPAQHSSRRQQLVESHPAACQHEEWAQSHHNTVTTWTDNWDEVRLTSQSGHVDPAWPGGVAGVWPRAVLPVAAAGLPPLPHIRHPPPGVQQAEAEAGQWEGGGTVEAVEVHLASLLHCAPATLRAGRDGWQWDTDSLLTADFVQGMKTLYEWVELMTKDRPNLEGVELYVSRCNSPRDMSRVSCSPAHSRPLSVLTEGK